MPLSDLCSYNHYYYLDPRLGEGVVVLDAVQHLGHAPEAVRLDVPPHHLVKILELDAVPSDVNLDKVLKMLIRVKTVSCLSTRSQRKRRSLDAFW